jgi:hypothetical protein
MSTQAATAESQQSSATGAQVAPPAHEFPKPGPEHEWLQQFVGEWEVEMECSMGPDQPPVKSTGTESVRSIGGFWIVAESKHTMGGTPMTSILSLGYDPAKKKYLGSWIDSCTGYFWKYEGTVDTAANKLTLETEGPSPVNPGTHTKFREVVEFKGKDHKVFTSSLPGEDGNWTTFVTMNYRRTK